MRYVAGRLAYMLFILIATTFAVSSMFELMPGDPAFIIIGEDATEAQRQALHERMGLDKPLPERYWSWVSDAASGDLGRSARNNLPVMDQIRQRAPVTLELLIGGQLLALLVAVPSAIYAAYRPGRLFDGASSATAFGLIATPHFVLSLYLVVVFSVQLHWFPVAGYRPLTADPLKNLHHMVLPIIVVAAPLTAIYQRLLRSDMQATLSEDFIAMAEAKGLSTPYILLRHALRPSLFSLVTLMGLSTARAIGGSIVVETIFGLPGIGRLLIDGIQQRDFVLVQGVVAIIAVAYVAINGAVDMIYGLLDPRVRRAR